MPRGEVTPPACPRPGWCSVRGSGTAASHCSQFLFSHVMLTMLAFRPGRQLQHPASSAPEHNTTTISPHSEENIISERYNADISLFTISPMSKLAMTPAGMSPLQSFHVNRSKVSRNIEVMSVCQ